MSYKVLSLKLRPQSFDDVIGQEHITKTLQNAIELDRVAHGYLFSGPRGVGKTTSARILAKALNCIKTKNCNPCGTCNNCIEITNGSNLDVQELDGASNRGIDEIRDLREVVKYPPNNGKYRIYIIDEVHMLTREAFNALLKTLEEPPQHVIFILATTDAHKIPTTILSRTQRFDFKPISVNKISNYLSKILDSESLQYDLESIELIAHKASGSLRDALSLIDQVIAYTNDSFNIDMIRDLLGIIKENIFLDIIKSIEQKNNHDIIHQLNIITDEGYSISDFINGFNEFIRNCMILKSGKNEKIKISDRSIKWVNETRFSILDFLKILDLCLKFESKLKTISQPHILLEALFMKLSIIHSINNNDTLKKNINLDNSSSAKNVSSESEKKELKANINKKITIEEIKESWISIIEILYKMNSKIGNFLENSIIESYDRGELIIKLEAEYGFHLKTLEKDIDIIENAVKKVLNKKIKVKFNSQETSNNKVQSKENQSSEHPLFMKVLETFDGEIIR